MSLFIGLMSGTSIDSIDAVLVDIGGNQIKLHTAYQHPWQAALREQLLFLTQEKGKNSNLHEIATLDIEIGQLFSEAVLKLLQKAQISIKNIRAIGNPGQTLYHHPDGFPAYTWQLGDPNTLVQITGITTIADFRRRDMAAGGQGAPLTPIFHNAFMRSGSENRIVVNIGGIANITVLPANINQPVIGFDTGPGNALLDAHYYQQHQLLMDKDGEYAATGKINTILLENMLADPYFSKPIPKSTGRDYFNLNWLNQYLTKLPPIKAEDIQATLCQLTVKTIIQSATVYKPQRLLVCGGGVHNLVLMTELQKQLPDCIVESSIAIGIDPDLVEAMSFAWLAKKRLDKKTSNLLFVTGAKQEVVLGSIYI
ncbi:MAG: anhydro-N-acetylmuramic acid kinase [Thiomargarita sp.]|nr:anhydro-N-acetylmuramic acid kinase [Thiomargarita sp.]